MAEIGDVASKAHGFVGADLAALCYEGKIITLLQYAIFYTNSFTNQSVKTNLYSVISRERIRGSEVHVIESIYFFLKYFI